MPLDSLSRGENGFKWKERCWWFSRHRIIQSSTEMLFNSLQYLSNSICVRHSLDFHMNFSYGFLCLFAWICRVHFSCEFFVQVFRINSVGIWNKKSLSLFNKRIDRIYFGATNVSLIWSEKIFTACLSREKASSLFMWKTERHTIQTKAVHCKILKFTNYEITFEFKIKTVMQTQNWEMHSTVEICLCVDYVCLLCNTLYAYEIHKHLY